MESTKGNRHINWFSMLAVSLLLVWAYKQCAVHNFKPISIRFDVSSKGVRGSGFSVPTDQGVFIVSPEAFLYVDLPARDSYRLKLYLYSKELIHEDRLKLFFNQKPLKDITISSRGGGIYDLNSNIPLEQTLDGTNELKLLSSTKLLKKTALYHYLRLVNRVGYMTFPEISVLHDSSSYLVGENATSLEYASLFAVFVLMFAMLGVLISRLNVNSAKGINWGFLPHIPSMGLILIGTIFSVLTPYQLVCDWKSFFLIIASLFFLTSLRLLVPFSKIKESLVSIFFGGFVLLMVLCGVAQVMHMEEVAGFIVDIAYVFLVAGVGLRVYYSIRSGEDKSRGARYMEYKPGSVKEKVIKDAEEQIEGFSKE